MSDLSDHVFADVVRAISDEIAASFEDPSSSVGLRDGRLIGRVGGMELWSFEADRIIPALPETPARVRVDVEEPIEATVIAVNEFDIVVGVDDPLPDLDGSDVRLSTEPTFILDWLRKRLLDSQATLQGGLLTESLLDIADEEPPHPPEEIAEAALRGISADQRGAVGRLVRPGVQFLWGPPGTGKTGTLAATVQHLVDSGKRVLVLAHANAAVDVAMVRVASRLADHPALIAGRVLRAGTPQSPEARSNQWINPDEVLRRSVPALVDEHEQLLERRAQLAKQLRRHDVDRTELLLQLADARTQLSGARKRLDEARNELYGSAQVIGTTLSRYVINDLMWTWPADVVIVDEASMASIPFVLAAASKGPDTLALFGDFRQLPPVAQSSTEAAARWLQRDVFELAGVTARVEGGLADDRLSILRTQYRMGSDIADVVSRLAYFGILRTAMIADERAADIAELEPSPGAQLVIVDTSQWETACLTDAEPDSFSRFNLASWVLSCSIACTLDDAVADSVGVIAAYRAQARLAADLLRERGDVHAATTHRFQGAESNVIVLDIVDAAPQRGPSRLTGSDPELSRRLLNVAASRARGKLIVVADLAFLTDHHARSSPARQLVELMTERQADVIPPTDFALRSSPEVCWSGSWGEAIARTSESPVVALDISVPDESFAGDDLRRWTHATLTHGGTVRLRLPVAAAGHFEDTAADIKLKTMGSGGVALVRDEDGGHRMIIGTRRADAPAATISSLHAVRTAWRLLSGEVIG